MIFRPHSHLENSEVWLFGMLLSVTHEDCLDIQDVAEFVQKYSRYMHLPQFRKDLLTRQSEIRGEISGLINSMKEQYVDFVRQMNLLDLHFQRLEGALKTQVEAYDGEIETDEWMDEALALHEESQALRRARLSELAAREKASLYQKLNALEGRLRTLTRLSVARARVLAQYTETLIMGRPLDVTSERASDLILGEIRGCLRALFHQETLRPKARALLPELTRNLWGLPEGADSKEDLESLILGELPEVLFESDLKAPEPSLTKLTNFWVPLQLGQTQEEYLILQCALRRIQENFLRHPAFIPRKNQVFSRNVTNLLGFLDDFGGFLADDFVEDYQTRVLPEFWEHLKLKLYFSLVMEEISPLAPPEGVAAQLGVLLKDPLLPRLCYDKWISSLSQYVQEFRAQNPENLESLNRCFPQFSEVPVPSNRQTAYQEFVQGIFP